MRTGNGRHRRPRQVPAIVVAAGVTGAGIAMPLLAATGANAADTATWDRVAQCESGGTWSADKGNDFYGGLQLSQSTWDLYGGRAYAPRPDLASRAQQIAVAQKILDDQGTKPWSGCAVASGLTRGSAAPGVDPGSSEAPSSKPSAESSSKPSAQSPAPSHSSGPSKGSSGDDRTDSGKTHSPKGGPSTTPSGTGGPGSPGDSSDPGKKGTGEADAGKKGSGSAESPEPGGKPSQTPSSTPSTPPGTSADPTTPATGATGTPTSGEGRHRGGSDEGEKGSAGSKGSDGAEGPARDDGGRSGGRHASRGGESRGGHASRTPQQAPRDYTVQSGDSLSVIAEEHSVSGGWNTLYERNHSTVGSDPDLIFPGQKLDLGT
ncbi:transglycosylase family protein [Streptomyces sp. NPDC050617]|uniref:transglycosylase family protein n=1 Tax=Streptomyces sp. NPDC050617 TaxID=3154628 RepID=UPI00342A26B8